MRLRGDRNIHAAFTVSPKPGFNLNSMNNFSGNKPISINHNFNNNEGLFLNVGSVLQRFKRSKQSSLAVAADVLATY